MAQHNPGARAFLLIVLGGIVIGFVIAAYLFGGDDSETGAKMDKMEHPAAETTTPDAAGASDDQTPPERMPADASMSDGVTPPDEMIDDAMPSEAMPDAAPDAIMPGETPEEPVPENPPPAANP